MNVTSNMPEKIPYLNSRVLLPILCVDGSKKVNIEDGQVWVVVESLDEFQKFFV